MPGVQLFHVAEILLPVIHVLVLVPEVVDYARELEVPFLASAVLKTVAQVNILSAPALVELVVAVDADEIFAEERHVATQCADLFLRYRGARK